MNCEQILQKISQSYSNILQENLVGIYVHGSIAFGCFHWAQSDIDFLVVVKNPPSLQKRVELIEALLHLEEAAPPKGFEMSVVLEERCRSFQYPTPYELHFSNAHRERYLKTPEKYCAEMNGTDRDLAAHFTVIHAVGMTLCGKEIPSVFGKVPESAYLDSIKSDVEHALEEITLHPVYIILNLCRVLAYLDEGLIASKEQGGHWGLGRLPAIYAPVLEAALQSYQSGKPFFADNSMLSQFAQFMLGQIFGRQ